MYGECVLHSVKKRMSLSNTIDPNLRAMAHPVIYPKVKLCHLINIMSKLEAEDSKSWSMVLCVEE
jgi:hypothetical protein